MILSPSGFTALYGALTGLLIYGIWRWRMNGLYGLLGAFFFLSTPVILRLSHWGYIDLGITFYTTAALLLLLRWRENRNAFGALALAGLSLDSRLATKPNGLVAALIIVMLFALVLAKPPRQSLFASMQESCAIRRLALLPFLPWLIKNWWQTGNPLLPVLPWLVSRHGSPLILAPTRLVSLRHRHLRQARTLIWRKYLADRRAAAEAVFLRPGR